MFEKKKAAELAAARKVEQQVALPSNDIRKHIEQSKAIESEF